MGTHEAILDGLGPRPDYATARFAMRTLYAMGEDIDLASALKCADSLFFLTMITSEGFTLQSVDRDGRTEVELVPVKKD